MFLTLEGIETTFPEELRAPLYALNSTMKLPAPSHLEWELVTGGDRRSTHVRVICTGFDTEGDAVGTLQWWPRDGLYVTFGFKTDYEGMVELVRISHLGPDEGHFFRWLQGIAEDEGIDFDVLYPDITDIVLLNGEEIEVTLERHKLNGTFHILIKFDGHPIDSLCREMTPSWFIGRGTEYEDDRSSKPYSSIKDAIITALERYVKFEGHLPGQEAW